MKPQRVTTPTFSMISRAGAEGGLLSTAIITFLLYPLTLVLGGLRLIATPVKFAPTVGFPIKLPLMTGELLFGRSGLDRDSVNFDTACPVMSSDCKFLRFEFLLLDVPYYYALYTFC